MFPRAIFAVLLLVATAHAQTTDQIYRSVYDSGNTSLRVKIVSGSAGGSPGGVSGNLQTNDGAGGFGAYPGNTCAALEYVQAVDASGNFTCDNDIGGNAATATLATTATTANAGDSATAFFSSGTIEVARGGTGAAPGADDQALISDSTSAATWRTVPNCTDTAGQHLNYTQSSNTFSCGTSGAATMQEIVWRPEQGTPPVASYATLDFRNVHPVLDFDAAADECIYFEGILPTAYAGGGLTSEILFAATSATSGAMGWLVAIERIGVVLDIDADSFAADQSASTTVSGTSGIPVKSTIAFTDGAQMDSLAAGEAFRARVCRDGDGGVVTDDATGDGELLRFRIYETP